MLPDAYRSVGMAPNHKDHGLLFTNHFDARQIGIVRDPASIEMDESSPTLVPCMTSYDRRRQLQPLEWEKNLAESVDLLRSSQTRHAKKFLTLIMNHDRWYLIGKFNEAVLQGEWKAAMDLMSEWVKARIPNTRDIEAQGGKVNRSALRAGHKGCMKGEFPWALQERSVPMQFPWLVPTSADGKHTSDLGCNFSCSTLDGREPLSHFRCETVRGMQELLYGTDLSFEANTVGLVLPSEFALLCQQLGIGKQPVRNALEQVQEHLKKRKRPDEKLLRAEMTQLFSLKHRSESGLSPQEHQEYCKFVFRVSIWKEMLLAEMVIDEHCLELMNPSKEAKARIERGRQNCFYVYGVWQTKKSRNQPTILEVHTQDGTTRLVQVIRVCLAQMVIMTVNLVEAPVVQNGDYFASRWAKVCPAEPVEVVEKSATVPTFETFDVYKATGVNIGHGVGKWRGFNGAFPKKCPVIKMPPMFDVPLGRIDKIFKLPTYDSAYMFPLPSSRASQQSKIASLWCNSDKVSAFVGNFVADLRAVDDATYTLAGEEDNEPRISIGKFSMVHRPLAAAIRHGFALRDDFGAGSNSSTKADVMQTCKYLLEEEPIRIKNILDPELPAFYPSVVSDMDTKWKEIKRSTSKEVVGVDYSDADPELEPWEESYNKNGVFMQGVLKENLGDYKEFNRGLASPPDAGLDRLNDEEKGLLAVWHRVDFPIAKDWTELFFALMFGQKDGERILAEQGFYDVKKVDGATGFLAAMFTTCGAFKMKLQEEVTKLAAKPLNKRKKEKIVPDGPRIVQAREASPKLLLKNQNQIAALLGDAYGPFLYDDAKATAKLQGEAEDLLRDEDSQEAGARRAKEGVDIRSEVFLQKLADAKKEFLETDKGKTQYLKTQQGFHQPDLDFCQLHCESLERGWEEVYCAECEQGVGSARPMWIGGHGPTLQYKTTVSDSLLQIACGPRSHVYREHSGAKFRCFCGWWFQGKLYKNKGLLVEQEPSKFHNCARKLATRKLRTCTFTPCKCEPSKKMWETKKITQKHTFTAAGQEKKSPPKKSKSMKLPDDDVDMDEL
eukprot:g16549.t1